MKNTKSNITNSKTVTTKLKQYAMDTMKNNRFKQNKIYVLQLYYNKKASFTR